MCPWTCALRGDRGRVAEERGLEKTDGGLEPTGLRMSSASGDTATVQWSQCWKPRLDTPRAGPSMARCYAFVVSISEAGVFGGSHGEPGSRPDGERLFGQLCQQGEEHTLGATDAHAVLVVAQLLLPLCSPNLCSWGSLRLTLPCPVPPIKVLRGDGLSSKANSPMGPWPQPHMTSASSIP